MSNRISRFLSINLFTAATLAMTLAACAENEFSGGVRVKKPVVFTSDAPRLPVATQDQAMATPLPHAADEMLGSFPAALQIEERLRFTLHTKEASTDFELKDVFKDQRDIFHQATRPSKTESYQQGYPARPTREVFDQEARRGMVDILVVIDNSISMKEEQINLSDKMNELIASIKKSDWQIGVITTSALMVDNVPRCAMTLIKSTDADASEKFRHAILAGTNGDRNEQGILQSVVGLSCPENPWLRASAPVAVLIVSDEDNCSAEYPDPLSTCPGGTPGESENYLIRYVEGELGREVGKNAGFYGIFSLPAHPCFSADKPGVLYQRLVDYKANGRINYGDICDASYKTTLNRISDNIATLLTSQFELKLSPLPLSLKLTLRLADGSERELSSDAYSLDGHTISFAAGKEPPDESTLVADYLIEGSAMFDQLTLQDDPAVDTVSVHVNGRPLAKDGFRVSGRTLQFTASPEPEARIAVDYRLDAALAKDFQLAYVPLKDSVRVRVNGIASEAFRLDQARRVLSFEQAPADGAEIAIDWTYRQGPQLTYALPLADAASQFEIWDGSWSIPFIRKDSEFTIPAGAHRAGKILKLRYQLPDRATRTFALGHMPIAESLRVLAGDPRCGLGNGIAVEGTKLTSDCAVSQTSDFELSYRYYQAQNSFSLQGVDEPERGHWLVAVDGVYTQDYRRSGATIALNFTPRPEAVIAVRYTFPEASAAAVLAEP